MTDVCIKRIAPGDDPHVEVRRILRKMLRMRGYDDDLSKIIISEKGKPRFAGGSPFFNFSDSGDHVACALSDVEVGVDIEQIRDISDKLCDRFLGGVRGGAKERTAAWTRYESLGKCEGCGIPHQLDPSDFVLTEYLTGEYSLCVCTKSEQCDRLIVITD